MSGIVHRHIETADPWGGLPPRVHNVPACHVVYPVVGNSNNVYTTANYFTSTQTAGTSYSVAPATQLDGYGRNVVALFSPNTASSAMYAAGTLKLYGIDYYGVAASESVAVSNIVSATSPWKGSVNFGQLNTIMVSGLKFHSDSSSARSDVSFRVGMGNKLGMPVYLQSSAGAIVNVWFAGTSKMSWGTHTDSTSGNQYTVVTGPYSLGGVSFSTTLGTASAVVIHYKMNCRSVPYEPGRHE